MKTQNDIASYVSDLRNRLHLRPEVMERIIAETEAHLQDRASAHMSNGMGRSEAESLAVAEFGPAWRVALRFRLAYLQPMKVIAWTVALLLIAQRVYSIYYVSINPRLGVMHALMGEMMIGGLAVFLIAGFVVTAVFPRRAVLAGGLVASVLSAFDSWQLVGMLRRTAGSEWSGHIWNGWQSGFSVRTSSTLHPQYVVYGDWMIILELLIYIAWTLMGVWVAGAIRAKIAERRARRAIA
ncbi:MAG TPA: permease prefix domain 1-containing protein [Armatimonadota bacterium]|jgi:hypothetical protein